MSGVNRVGVSISGALSQCRTLSRRWGDVGIPALMLCLVLFACFVLPLVSPVPSPIGGKIVEANLPFLAPGHLFGTDSNGNDNWSRLLHGGRASLQIAFAVNLLGLLLGGFAGAIAAYVGGVVDSIVMRVLDTMIAFPPLVLAIAIAQVLGPSHINTIWALTFLSVPAFARLARSATLRLRDQPFMIAGELAGTGVLRVLIRHVAPNVVPQLATFGLLGMGVVIIIEGGLSFLGLGIRPPEPSWGNMIYHGQQSLLTRPALLLFPSTFLLFTVLSFNLLGEALRARWSRK
jgi:peptide/nickel transport system permease protein